MHTCSLLPMHASVQPEFAHPGAVHADVPLTFVVHSSPAAAQLLVNCWLPDGKAAHVVRTPLEQLVPGVVHAVLVSTQAAPPAVISQVEPAAHAWRLTPTVVVVM